jgi:hypothetical protein
MIEEAKDISEGYCHCLPSAELAYRKFEIQKFAKKKILFDRILAILFVKGPPIFIFVCSWP